jgi:hypothetical protein
VLAHSLLKGKNVTLLLLEEGNDVNFGDNFDGAGNGGNDTPSRQP